MRHPRSLLLASLVCVLARCSGNAGDTGLDAAGDGALRDVASSDGDASNAPLDALDAPDAPDVSAPHDAHADALTDTPGDRARPVDAGPCTDMDGDHYGLGPGCLGPDCDDSNPEVHPGAAEVCNGIDDNCNNRVDDGLGSTTCGVGACTNTVNNCAGGRVQRCAPRASSSEVCDGVDNDCDGTVDNGLGTVSCGTGACHHSVPACASGMMQTCTPGTPRAEVCNNVDDDCNGTVDDGIAPLSCGTGACRRTVAACVSGVTQTCTPGSPRPEVCDGVDNDCDSVVDDGCPTSVSLSVGASSPPFGTVSGGTAFDDACPSGTALVGVYGRTNALTGYPGQLGLICAAVTLVEQRTPTPYTYVVTTGASTMLPLHGTLLTGTTFTYTCPSNEFAAGIHGHFGPEIHGIALDCERLTVSGAPSAFVVGAGARAGSLEFGAPVGTVYTYDCPGNQVIAHARGEVTSAFGSLQVVCAAPNLTVR